MRKHLLVFLLMPLLYKAQTFTCGDTLIDIRDGKKYTTVLIGSQCWMKQNLNYGKTVSSYSSTTTHSDMFNNSIPEKYAPNGDSSKLPLYGGLYEWDEVMNYSTAAGSQGLCPNGWHVPTDAEWQTMIASAGGTIVAATGGYGGNKLKNIGEGFAGGAGTNTSGFSARAAGDRDSYGIFYGLTLRFIFWTSTQTNPAQAYQYTLWAEKDTIARDGLIQKMTGLSCRCVRSASAGVEEKELKNRINIYPNPAAEFLKVTIGVNEKARIRICNMIGDLVYEENFTSYLEVDTKQWAKGVYFYMISNDKESAGGKLLIH